MHFAREQLRAENESGHASSQRIGSDRRYSLQFQARSVAFLQWKLLSDTCIKAVWLSWEFLLRAQSDCLLSARPMLRERMDEFSFLKSPAVIGVGKGQQAIKLHRREHMAGG